jgi:hypothetical protein
VKKPIDVPLLFSLWNTSIENRDLAGRLGVAVSRLWEIRKQYGLPYRAHERKSPTVDPSPEEIEKRTAVIRRRWTKTEEAQRLVGSRPGWHPPECRVLLG